MGELGGKDSSKKHYIISGRPLEKKKRENGKNGENGKIIFVHFSTPRIKWKKNCFPIFACFPFPQVEKIFPISFLHPWKKMKKTDRFFPFQFFHLLENAFFFQFFYPRKKWKKLMRFSHFFHYGQKIEILFITALQWIIGQHIKDFLPYFEDFRTNLEDFGHNIRKVFHNTMEFGLSFETFGRSIEDFDRNLRIIPNIKHFRKNHENVGSNH